MCTGRLGFPQNEVMSNAGNARLPSIVMWSKDNRLLRLAISHISTKGCDYSLKRTIYPIQRRDLTIFQNRLIHPTPFDRANFESSSQNEIKPKRYTERSPTSLRRCVQVGSHATSNARCCQSNVENIAIKSDKRVAAGFIGNGCMMRPCKQSLLLRSGV
jgi:hypothetical protein